jgi:hypothetical protein
MCSAPLSGDSGWSPAGIRLRYSDAPDEGKFCAVQEPGASYEDALLTVRT